jgi:hypothetical protein
MEKHKNKYNRHCTEQKDCAILQYSLQKSNKIVKKIAGFDTITGYYHKEHLKIKAIIRKVAALGNFSNIYIGATYDIATRFEKYTKWEFKHVLYETTSLDMAKIAEENLISYQLKNVISCNKSPLSKGLRKGKPKYYIYLLADNSCQLRGIEE